MERPLFMVDCMLGRLAKWLRIIGFDAKYYNEIDDNEMIKKAGEEGRILLSRDTKLIIPPGIKSIFIEDDHWFYQVRQVLLSLPEKFPLKPLSRCILCNAELEPVSKEKVKEVVPPYVYSTQETFVKCPNCGKIYWQATHQQRMKETLAMMLKDTGFELEGEEFNR